MEVSDNVWDLVNRRKMTTGILATAGADGRCNAAIYGSLRLSDLETMTMTMGDTRTLANLKENPHAAFIVTGGESLEDISGARVYLKVKEIVEEGPVLQTGKRLIAEAVGEQAAARMKAFVTFEVVETRPLIDAGQGV